MRSKKLNSVRLLASATALFAATAIVPVSAFASGIQPVVQDAYTHHTFSLPGIDATPDANGNLIDNAKTSKPRPVPEPATLALLGIGLVGLAFIVRRRAA